jgi:hypothetical protein
MIVFFLKQEDTARGELFPQSGITAYGSISVNSDKNKKERFVYA